MGCSSVSRSWEHCSGLVCSFELRKTQEWLAQLILNYMYSERKAQFVGARACTRYPEQ